MLHFEGARGAERRVRAVRAADGEVEHYEGEQGAERCVRAEFANGMVQHYEGEGDAERMVHADARRGTREASCVSVFFLEYASIMYYCACEAYHSVSHIK